MKIKPVAPALTTACIFMLLTGDWPGTSSYLGRASHDEDRVQAVPASQSPAQHPSEEKDVFVDEDLKEERIRGEWAIASKPDLDQAKNPSAPVVVKGVATYSGRGKYSGLAKIRKVEIENRRAASVDALQLRWFIVSVAAPTPVLLEGVTPLFDVRLKPNGTQIIDIPHISLTRVLKPLRKEGELNGVFYLVLGVQEVRFADGSSWERGENVSILNVSFPAGGDPRRRRCSARPYSPGRRFYRRNG